jgi:DNA-binding transcriptional ArsR family regulator
LLAEPDRMRVFAAVVLGAATPSDVARRTGLAPRGVAIALRRLAEDGLIAPKSGRS